jgi:hypothetical protein
MTDDANTLITEVAKHPTLDEFMRRAQASINWNTEGPDFVQALRDDRARFIAKGLKKQEKEDDDE